MDFLVDLPRGYNLLTQRIPLQQCLTEITGRHTDLVPEHELSPFIRRNVLDEAVDLWDIGNRIVLMYGAHATTPTA